MDGAPLTPTEFASAVTAITGAFGDPTRRDIFLFTRERLGGATATETAEHFDLHPNVARHHLDKLAAGGYLEIAVEHHDGASAGRPSKHYRSANPSAPLELPIPRDDLLISMLGRALAMLPDGQAEQMAEEVGAEVGRSMAESIGPEEIQRSFRSAMQVVADALTAHGFAARAVRAGEDQLRIVSEHCPFGGAPIEYPVICAVDRGLVRGMLSALYGEATTDLSSSLPMGDAVCITDVNA
ncbi:MAG: helix-turn-helix domain-containing protein [Actinobacteria bacterium]|nr:helix-turn-helix domain-containing protein [Actinomycetota bacterium]MBT3687096.1 helix-turn-helix domain-containing protein [Actinomycetota bacterium]MBT4037525.1 helix-turn-helix domain-containing protein [Actinomycetota bacterium]MBT4279825.1 helix-turn-helix domain-containing protein [Actinomycetota bacterium]MBT4342628.1 helix-turn-helix domain-containing protein [Actinomycetota bacterium]